jgi:hypothetical protein
MNEEMTLLLDFPSLDMNSGKTADVGEGTLESFAEALPEA